MSPAPAHMQIASVDYDGFALVALECSLRVRPYQPPKS